MIWIILDHPTPAKVGHSYELILTTRGGLCRYRIGDAVKITGKVGEMPLVELQGRAGKCFKLRDWATALGHGPCCYHTRISIKYFPSQFWIATNHLQPYETFWDLIEAVIEGVCSFPGFKR